MNDTRITIVGTALTNPERKVLEKSGHVVVNFRVVANVRRQNPDTKEWYDAANFRVRVTCWRRLADNVMTSISAGDPVIVLGRISTRDWKARFARQRSLREPCRSQFGTSPRELRPMWTAMKCSPRRACSSCRYWLR